ncbi:MULTISPECIES: cyclodeaminase/cyclohydrolase family protein [Vitreoscilla]|uniref:Bifunctional protein FolD n=1 Tax=Vitreoscilla stercoraria TaxID=61 RepID=A0ABY4EEX6_VITST|nr:MULTISPECIES: cyclodeaminase/cyclohydrolase family protein [Vitreoscilla]AUZ05154.2 formiminotransferase-cyclodeaminase [Vitreoscilla sp. C1]UOO93495.1 cyclodeaminase/cyclohydrolase family protein [Vitreoscilla stercoraria]
MIANETVSSYLSRLASNAPTPGGGAVGALHVAHGAALISMVAKFTVGERFEHVQNQIEPLIIQSEQLIEEALLIADQDEYLFNDLIQAYRLPRDTQEQKAYRLQVIQAATKTATIPQIRTVKLSERILQSADTLVLIGNKSVISDVAAAAESAKAALATALVTLEININSIEEKPTKSELIDYAKLAEKLIQFADTITGKVRQKLKPQPNNDGQLNSTLSGKPVAEKLKTTIQHQVAVLAQQDVTACLAVILATDNEATIWYVNSIKKAAQSQGIKCEVYTLHNPSEEALKTLILELNQNTAVHGIILQTPLPKNININHLINLIDKNKDIDGANPLSLGYLSAGQKAFAPATARAVMEILDYYDIPLAGEEVTVIGRSNVVGKPLTQLLLKHNATVTLCHSHTQNLSQRTKAAKIVVVAVGQINLLKDSHITTDSIVIDVGTNIDENGRLVGDVAPEVAEIAHALTPVPGGVGTVTTTLLLLHTVEAAMSLSNANVLNVA